MAFEIGHKTNNSISIGLGYDYSGIRKTSSGDAEFTSRFDATGTKKSVYDAENIV